MIKKNIVSASNTSTEQVSYPDHKHCKGGVKQAHNLQTIEDFHYLNQMLTA